MTRRPVDVVLAGGVFRTTDETFYARLDNGIRAVVHEARLVHLDVPPVTGAGLHGLDSLGAGAPAARTRLRDALRAWRG